MAANTHTCGITVAKNLYCWGNNASGQIGKGVAAGNQPSPLKIGGSGVWTSIAGGDVHTCGITMAKNLYCWGYNGNGQIGDGTSFTSRPSPTKIGGSGVWTSVNGGTAHTCGITVAKNVYCWGFDDNGQVGNGTPGGNKLVPTRVP